MKPYNTLTYCYDRILNPNNLTLKYIRDRTSFAQNLYSRDLKAHYGCVNAIEFSSKGGELIASGGDDRRVLIWKVEEALSDIGKPRALKGEHSSNIFCLAFDSDNTKVFSGGNDEQVIAHDLTTGETLDVFMHEDAVYGISVDPTNSNVFASAGDDGRILIYDTRLPVATDPFVLANYTSSMHAVMYNPVEPRLLATANAKEGLGLWDVRKPRSCVLRYGGGYVQQSCMSVRFNRLGDQLLALRRRMPPVLYSIHSNQPICEFDHPGYFNSCTMKSCSFAGDKDQYILSGSDDFKLYMWKIPEDLSQREFVHDVHMVLGGHRSIVNQVRFNSDSHLIISSGVEKIVKVWSPFQIPNSTGSIEKIEKKNSERPVYTHEEYINLVLRSGHFMTHDYSNQSVEEDPRMIAFFDSLVQRELEGNSTDAEMSSSEEEMYERMVQLSRSDVSDSSESEADQNSIHSNEELHSDQDSIDDPAFSPFTIAFASVMAAQAAENNDGASRLVNSESSVARSNSGSHSDASNGGSDNNSISENQGVNTSRKSISDMIAQKRREMKKQATELKKTTAKRKRHILSSSESSDDEEKDSQDIANSVEGNNLGHSSNVLSAQRQKKHLQLKKLKQLRENVLQSESENAFVNSDNLDEERTLNTEKSKSADPLKGKDNQEIGPYLNYPKSNSIFACTSSDTNNSRSGNVIHPCVSEDHHIVDQGKEGKTSESKTCENNDHHKNIDNKVTDHHSKKQENNVLDHHTKNADNKNDDHCANSDDFSTKKAVMNTNEHCDKNSGKKCVDNNTTKSETVTANDSADQNIAGCSHSSAEQNDEENDQPMWTEFKRFKRRLSKARRYYRQHSGQDDNCEN